ncbi:O-antigen ligase family protein [Vibrio sp. Vb339]|uniref:O-antigen ligase family protein n=1 Tax=Vibrio sp. Vb339 TaxID=1192013 RepID=UPI001556F6ED|nr:O-antigen ligase family protein [Vibrio sp. Vb339]
MLKNLYKIIHELPLLWAVSGMFIINGGDKTLVAIIIISTLTKALGHLLRIDRIEISYSFIKKILLVMVIYSSFKYYTNGYSSSEIRVLISTLLYAFISFPRKIPIKPLITVSCLSSIFVLVQTIYIMNGHNWDRMQLPLNAIPYANYSATISLLAFVAMLFVKEIKFKYLSALALICYSIVVLVVDTRGTWLALLAAYSAIASLFVFHKRSWKLTVSIVSSFIIIPIVCYPIVEDRVENSKREVALLAQGNLDSSWGMRIQLWQAGYQIFRDNPSIEGLGQTAHLQMIQDMYKQGRVKASLAQFDNKNFHNSIIDRTVKYGLIGLILYIAIILTPIYYGLRQEFNYKSILFIALPTFIFTAGLTYIPLSHPGTYFIYLFCLIANSNEPNNIEENNAI